MALDYLQTGPDLVQPNTTKKIFRVHRDVYTNRDIFKREKEIIFGKCWLYVGHGSEIADRGRFVTRRIGGRDLIFVREKNGEVAAFYNNCTHRGARLCRERGGQARNFTCPYHGWVFNTTGQLMSMNATEGFSADVTAGGRLDLVRAPKLESYRNFYFVNYNPNAISLFDYLADARGAIDSICDQTEAEMMILPGIHGYSVRANYKYMCENSYDGYHVGTVHSSYLDYLRDKLAGSPQASLVDGVLSNFSASGGARGLGMGHAILDSFVPTGRPVAQWLPGMPLHLKEGIETKRARLVELFGEERAKYIAESQKNLVIFPNLVINDGVAVTVRYVEPDDYNKMRISAWALGPSDETAELRALRLDNCISFLGPAGFGSPDDIEMLELCQDSSEHSPLEWSEISKGMGAEADRRFARGGSADEVQMQAYWQQWDLVMKGIETLEVE